MPNADEPGAPETVVAQLAMADGGEGQGHRIAVVYDDATDRIKRTGTSTTCTRSPMP
ncbi:hypothetical protein [Streptomyces deccanensis]|uniref:hypothetical protein n=1 Tax=Streptomyces deccanensis TaxID=424188 RepID=UPI001EFB60B3|nr:hypothetical protein [Streptomyces deccanensis]ULR51336.1 hypothetical protein L3078_19660 [Streptomyces deccanensis]